MLVLGFSMQAELMWLRRTKEVANNPRNLLGCGHAEGSSQVHDELTLLNLSHIQRVLCTEVHDDLNTWILEHADPCNTITQPKKLDCGMNSQTARLWSEPKRQRSGTPL